MIFSGDSYTGVSPCGASLLWRVSLFKGQAHEYPGEGTEVVE